MQPKPSHEAVNTYLPKTLTIHKNGFIIGYDGKNRSPLWVYEKVTAESLNGSAKRANFFEDRTIPKQIRGQFSDYSKSGYNRGHMAPAGDHNASEEAMRDTFLLSNISPQDPSFNRGYWASLEKHVSEPVERHDKVTVVTGPLFLPVTLEDGKKFVAYEVIGDNNIAVPTHYFKLIRANGFEEAYILPNIPIDRETPLEKFKSTLEKIERLSGVVFGQ